MRKPPRALAVLVLLVAVGAAATAPPAAVAAGHAKHHRRAKVARPPLRPQLDGGALYGDGAAGAATPGTIPSASTAPGVTGGAVVAATASTGPTGTVGPTAPTSAGGVAAPGPPVNPRPTTGATGATGTTGPTAPGSLAQILPDGLAQAPANAPLAVQQAIAAGNELIGKPYLWGGGHRSWIASGYDCSGAVSFALHGAGLLDAPLISGAFATWGLPGAGAWITIYANPTHAYVDIAGIRLDTSRTDDPGGLDGPRWRPLRISDRGYAVRHPAAY